MMGLNCKRCKVKLPSSPGQSFTARLPESRYSPSLHSVCGCVCVCVCVCASEPVHVHVCESLLRSLLQSCPATAAAQAEEGI
ncbi:hypothetical protein JOQ06_018368 [Pogonophryne albipinna]|uniref:Uncharacterized protein n=1 Tax=Pogonophryne albipinna TaxID=1090488 RepID=A0AAD6AIX1_9TELE|nr:hypothetical protein JOQ06_018368 [Pogonophryne albipinna]